VPFDDKQQQGQFVWQKGLLFNAMPTAALTIQAAAVFASPNDLPMIP